MLCWTAWELPKALGLPSGSRSRHSAQRANDWPCGEHANEFANTFVKADTDELLAHFTCVDGLCHRSNNLGPIGQRLMHESESGSAHSNVPEFGTFWSSSPLTASLGRTSAKLLMLLLAIFMSYLMYDDYPYRPVKEGSWLSADFVILDVFPDPGDKHLVGRAWQMTRFGPLFGASSRDNLLLTKPMPYGSVDNLVEKYTILEANHHISTFATPLPEWPLYYYSLAGQHPTKTEYYAFVWEALFLYWYKVQYV